MKTLFYKIVAPDDRFFVVNEVILDDIYCSVDDDCHWASKIRESTDEEVEQYKKKVGDGEVT